MVGTSKNGAGRGSCVQKGTISGKKWSACPKRGQKGVCMSKKGQKGTKRGRKGSARPKMGQARVRVSKKGRFQARRGRRVQKRTVPGKKGSARPNRAGTGPKKDGSGQEGVGESKNG